MTKIIIYADGGVSDGMALTYALKVINNGKISNNNTQYCHITKFESGYFVYADKTKSETHTFRVWKEI